MLTAGSGARGEGQALGVVLLATRSRAPPERKSAGSRLSPAKAETEAVRVWRAGPACSWGCARCRRVAWGGSNRVGSVAAGTCASRPLPIPSFSLFFLPLVSFILSHPLFPFLFFFLSPFSFLLSLSSLSSHSLPFSNCSLAKSQRQN